MVCIDFLLIKILGEVFFFIELGGFVMKNR